MPALAPHAVETLYSAYALPLTPYQARAGRRWPRAAWITGDGAWACIADCPAAQTVTLHPTEDDARRALSIIDGSGCGHSCWKLHSIVDLDRHRRRRPKHGTVCPVCETWWAPTLRRVGEQCRHRGWCPAYVVQAPPSPTVRSLVG